MSDHRTFAESGGVASLLGGGEVVERPGELAVAASAQTMSGLVLRGWRFERRGPAEPGERGFAVAATVL